MAPNIIKVHSSPTAMMKFSIFHPPTISIIIWLLVPLLTVLLVVDVGNLSRQRRYIGSAAAAAQEEGGNVGNSTAERVSISSCVKANFAVVQLLL